MFDVESVGTYQRQEKPIRSETVKRRGPCGSSEWTKCKIKRIRTQRNKRARAKGRIPGH